MCTALVEDVCGTRVLQRFGHEPRAALSCASPIPAHSLHAQIAEGHPSCRWLPRFDCRSSSCVLMGCLEVAPSFLPPPLPVIPAPPQYKALPPPSPSLSPPCPPSQPRSWNPAAALKCTPTARTPRTARTRTDSPDTSPDRQLKPGQPGQPRPPHDGRQPGQPGHEPGQPGQPRNTLTRTRAQLKAQPGQRPDGPTPRPETARTAHSPSSSTARTPAARTARTPQQLEARILPSDTTDLFSRSVLEYPGTHCETPWSPRTTARPNPKSYH